MIIDDDVNNFIRSNLKDSNNFLRKLELYASENFVPIAKPETAAFLKTICASKRPERILEAGTAIGYSSIIMSEYLSLSGIVDTIEINEETALIARKNIKEAGCQDKINVIIADASDVFKCMDKKYDMVFLDAAKGQYKDILEDAKRVLNVGGILISDNVLFDGRVSKEAVGRKFRTIVINMREYIEKLVQDEKFETSILSVGDGLTFSVKLKD